MEDPDLVALIYPLTNEAKRIIRGDEKRPQCVKAQEADARLVDAGVSRLPISWPINDHAVGYTQPLPQTSRLELRFSRGPRSSQGFVAGTSTQCDLVLPADREYGLSDQHFALTFDSTNRLIVRDLDTRCGTQILYGNEGQGLRRNFVWIVGRDHIPCPNRRIVIRLNAKLKFLLVEGKHKATWQQYTDNINRFRQERQGTATIKDLPRPLYLRRELLGRGGFGEVTRLWDVSTGRELALKKPVSVHKRASWKNEINIMRSIQHEHIVQLVSYRMDPVPELYLEYMRHGNLEDEHERSPFSKEECWQILSQSASALQYLHEQPRPIVHRDIKPENILVQSRDPRDPQVLRIKLSDFGLSKSGPLQTLCGSRTYCPPEIPLFDDDVPSETYTESVDVWCLGVLLLRFAYHLPDSCHVVGRRWCKRIVDHVNTLRPDEMVDILQGMLVLEAGKRSSMREVSTQIESARARSFTQTPASQAAKAGGYIARESLERTSEGQQGSDSSPQVSSRPVDDDHLAAQGDPLSPSTASDSGASTVVINRRGTAAKRSLKPTSSGKRQRKQRQRLGPGEDHGPADQLCSPERRTRPVVGQGQDQPAESTSSVLTLRAQRTETQPQERSASYEQDMEDVVFHTLEHEHHGQSSGGVEPLSSQRVDSYHSLSHFEQPSTDACSRVGYTIDAHCDVSGEDESHAEDDGPTPRAAPQVGVGVGVGDFSTNAPASLQPGRVGQHFSSREASATTTSSLHDSLQRSLTITISPSSASSIASELSKSSARPQEPDSDGLSMKGRVDGNVRL